MAKVKEDSKGRKGKAKSLLLGNPIKLSTYCSAETLPVRREWHNILIFKVLKGKTCNPGYSTQEDYDVEQKEK